MISERAHAGSSEGASDMTAKVRGRETRGRTSPLRLFLALVSIGIPSILLVAAYSADWRFRLPAWFAETPPETLTAVARQMVIPYQVLAGGELNSPEAVDVVCEVEGTQLKIEEMIPEGTLVEADQVVVRLDPSDLNNQLAQKKISVTQAQAAAKAAEEELKIQRNLAESAVAEAMLEVTLAELDRKKYMEGEYQVELNDLRGSIALAETDLQEAEDMVTHFEMLVRKGFRSREQLEAKQQAVERAKFNLDRDREKLLVLERFTKERKEVELTAKAEEAVRELERIRSSNAAAVTKAETDLEVARATAQLELQQLQKIEEQLRRCDVRAPIAGTLIYAKDNNKKVELGAPIHFKQKLFSLPDLTELHVWAFIHESEIQQVELGMQAEIRVDAFPDLLLNGEVIDISTYYDATRHWMSGGVKEYATQVAIRDWPDGIALKPGMTARVTIQIGELSRGVIVPVAAIAMDGEQCVGYRQSEDGFQRVPLTIGNNTEDYVEVLSGLNPGDRVALDPRIRMEQAREAN